MGQAMKPDGMQARISKEDLQGVDRCWVAFKDGLQVLAQGLPERHAATSKNNTSSLLPMFRDRGVPWTRTPLWTGADYMRHKHGKEESLLEGYSQHNRVYFLLAKVIYSASIVQQNVWICKGQVAPTGAKRLLLSRAICGIIFHGRAHKPDWPGEAASCRNLLSYYDMAYGMFPFYMPL